MNTGKAINGKEETDELPKFVLQCSLTRIAFPLPSLIEKQALSVVTDRAFDGTIQAATVFDLCRLSITEAVRWNK